MVLELLPTEYGEEFRRTQAIIVRRRRVGSLVLAVTLLTAGTVLAAWKHNRLTAERAATQPEPVEAVTVATATAREHRESTTAIGTVLALESITLRNELAGTVRHVSLTPGAIVEPGRSWSALDTSVEAADLRALQGAGRAGRDHPAPARLPSPARGQRGGRGGDQAALRRDISAAQVERAQAVIAKKIIRAPFRARVGLADVHVGQYLNQGVQLTTLQGVSDEENVGLLRAPERRRGPDPRLDGGDCHRRGGGANLRTHRGHRREGGSATRNASSVTRFRGKGDAISRRIGSGCRCRWGTTGTAVAVPATALRKGPGGDHVWVLAADDGGALRAHERPVASGRGGG